MFDTSVVRAHAISAPRTATLVISIALHSIAVVAAIALTLTSTSVPSAPPKQMELYRPAELPSPPPAPLGVRRPAAAVPHRSEARVQAPQSMMAPAAIPEQIPVVGPASATSLAPAATTETGEGPIGDPNGVPGGVDNGVTGGSGVVDGPHVIGERGLIPPHVLTRIAPQFPQLFRNAVTSTTVVVQCVIGKDGRIHDPQIVKSSFTPFNDAVLQALRQWTFAPGLMNGEPVDTYFSLTVNFQIVR